LALQTKNKKKLHNAKTFANILNLFLLVSNSPSPPQFSTHQSITITQLLSENKPTVDVIDKLGTKGEEEGRVKDTYKRGQWVISEKNK